jgi:hypothetical protein
MELSTSPSETLASEPVSGVILLDMMGFVGCNDWEERRGWLTMNDWMNAHMGAVIRGTGSTQAAQAGVELIDLIEGGADHGEVAGHVMDGWDFQMSSRPVRLTSSTACFSSSWDRGVLLGTCAAHTASERNGVGEQVIGLGNAFWVGAHQGLQ